MESLKLAIVLMAITQDRMKSLETDGRHAVATGKDLDALPDFGWHMPNVRGSVAAGFTAVFGRWQSASRARARSAQIAPAES